MNEKIDKLLEMGYTFHFPNAGEGDTGNVPGTIRIPYESSEESINSILDKYLTKTTYNELRNYVLGKQLINKVKKSAEEVDHKCKKKKLKKKNKKK